MIVDVRDDVTLGLVHRYVERLALPAERLWVTTERATFVRWLGRPVGSAIGGAYVLLPRGNHAVLVNLSRIDRTLPRAIEIVVAEELLHMRDNLDGDLRRHAKHGHNRIAHRVAALTGATLEEIRGCLIPVRRRPFRYVYECPRCGVRVPRRVRGDWSCRSCSPVYDRRYRFRLVAGGGPPGDDDGPTAHETAPH